MTVVLVAITALAVITALDKRGIKKDSPHGGSFFANIFFSELRRTRNEKYLDSVSLDAREKLRAHRGSRTSFVDATQLIFTLDELWYT